MKHTPSRGPKDWRGVRVGGSTLPFLLPHPFLSFLPANCALLKAFIITLFFWGDILIWNAWQQQVWILCRLHGLSWIICKAFESSKFFGSAKQLWSQRRKILCPSFFYSPRKCQGVKWNRSIPKAVSYPACKGSMSAVCYSAKIEMLIAHTDTKFLPEQKVAAQREHLCIVREDAIIHHPAIKGETVTRYRLALTPSFFLYRGHVTRDVLHRNQRSTCCPSGGILWSTKVTRPWSAALQRFPIVSGSSVYLFGKVATNLNRQSCTERALNWVFFLEKNQFVFTVYLTTSLNNLNCTLITSPRWCLADDPL